MEQQRRQQVSSLPFPFTRRLVEGLVVSLPFPEALGWTFIGNLEGFQYYTLGDGGKSFGPFQINVTRKDIVTRLGLRFPEDIYAPRGTYVSSERLERILQNNLKVIKTQSAIFREMLRRTNPELYNEIYTKPFHEISSERFSEYLAALMTFWNAPAHFARVVRDKDYSLLIPQTGVVYRLASFQRRREALERAVRMVNEVLASLRKGAVEAVETQLRPVFGAQPKPAVPPTSPRPYYPEEVLPELSIRLAVNTPSISQMSAQSLGVLADDILRKYPDLQKLVPRDLGKEEQGRWIAAAMMLGRLVRDDVKIATLWRSLSPYKKQALLSKIVSLSKLVRGRDEKELMSSAISLVPLYREFLSQLTEDKDLGRKVKQTIAEAVGIVGTTIWESLKDIGKDFIALLGEAGQLVSVADPQGYFVRQVERYSPYYRWMLQQRERPLEEAKNLDDYFTIRTSRFVYETFNKLPLINFLWEGVVKGTLNMFAGLVGNVAVLLGKGVRWRGAEEWGRRFLRATQDYVGTPFMREVRDIARDPRFRRLALEDAIVFLGANFGTKYLRKDPRTGKYVPTPEGWEIFAQTLLLPKINYAMERIATEISGGERHRAWFVGLAMKQRAMGEQALGSLIGVPAVGKLISKIASIGTRLASGRTIGTLMKEIGDNPLASLALAETGNPAIALQVAKGLAQVPWWQKIPEVAGKVLLSAVYPGHVLEPHLFKWILGRSVQKVGINGWEGIMEIAAKQGPRAAIETIKPFVNSAWGKARLAATAITSGVYSLLSVPPDVPFHEKVGYFLGGFAVNWLYDLPTNIGAFAKWVAGRRGLISDQRLFQDPFVADVIAQIYARGGHAALIDSIAKQLASDPHVAQRLNNLLTPIYALDYIAKYVEDPKKIDEIRNMHRMFFTEKGWVVRDWIPEMMEDIKSLPDQTRKTVERWLKFAELADEAYKEVWAELQKREAAKKKVAPEQITQLPPSVTEELWSLWKERLSQKAIKRRPAEWRNLSAEELRARAEELSQEILYGLHVMQWASEVHKWFVKNNLKHFANVYTYGLLEFSRSLWEQMVSKDVPAHQRLPEFYNRVRVLMDVMKQHIAYDFANNLAAEAYFTSLPPDIKQTQEGALRIRLESMAQQFLLDIENDMISFARELARAEEPKEVADKWLKRVDEIANSTILTVISPEIFSKAFGPMLQQFMFLARREKFPNLFVAQELEAMRRLLGRFAAKAKKVREIAAEGEAKISGVISPSEEVIRYVYEGDIFAGSTFHPFEKFWLVPDELKKVYFTPPMDLRDEMVIPKKDAAKMANLLQRLEAAWKEMGIMPPDITAQQFLTPEKINHIVYLPARFLLTPLLHPTVHRFVFTPSSELQPPAALIHINPEFIPHLVNRPEIAGTYDYYIIDLTPIERTNKYLTSRTAVLLLHKSHFPRQKRLQIVKDIVGLIWGGDVTPNIWDLLWTNYEFFHMQHPEAFGRALPHYKYLPDLVRRYYNHPVLRALFNITDDVKRQADEYAPLRRISDENIKRELMTIVWFMTEGSSIGNRDEGVRDLLHVPGVREFGIEEGGLAIVYASFFVPTATTILTHSLFQALHSPNRGPLSIAQVIDELNTRILARFPAGLQVGDRRILFRVSSSDQPSVTPVMGGISINLPQRIWIDFWTYWLLRLDAAARVHTDIDIAPALLPRGEGGISDLPVISRSVEFVSPDALNAFFAYLADRHLPLLAEIERYIEPRTLRKFLEYNRSWAVSNLTHRGVAILSMFNRLIGFLPVMFGDLFGGVFTALTTEAEPLQRNLLAHKDILNHLWRLNTKEGWERLVGYEIEDTDEARAKAVADGILKFYQIWMEITPIMMNISGAVSHHFLMSTITLPPELITFHQVIQPLNLGVFGMPLPLRFFSHELIHAMTAHRIGEGLALTEAEANKIRLALMEFIAKGILREQSGVVYAAYALWENLFGENPIPDIQSRQTAEELLQAVNNTITAFNNITAAHPQLERIPPLQNTLLKLQSLQGTIDRILRIQDLIDANNRHLFEHGTSLLEDDRAISLITEQAALWAGIKERVRDILKDGREMLRMLKYTRGFPEYEVLNQTINQLLDAYLSLGYKIFGETPESQSRMVRVLLGMERWQEEWEYYSNPDEIVAYVFNNIGLLSDLFSRDPQLVKNFVSALTALVKGEGEMAAAIPSVFWQNARQGILLTGYNANAENRLWALKNATEGWNVRQMFELILWGDILRRGAIASSVDLSYLSMLAKLSDIRELPQLLLYLPDLLPVGEQIPASSAEIRAELHARIAEDKPPHRRGTKKMSDLDQIRAWLGEELKGIELTPEQKREVSRILYAPSPEELEALTVIDEWVYEETQRMKRRAEEQALQEYGRIESFADQYFARFTFVWDNIPFVVSRAVIEYVPYSQFIQRVLELVQQRSGEKISFKDFVAAAIQHRANLDLFTRKLSQHPRLHQIIFVHGLPLYHNLSLLFHSFRDRNPYVTIEKVFAEFGNRLGEAMLGLANVWDEYWRTMREEVKQTIARLGNILTTNDILHHSAQILTNAFKTLEAAAIGPATELVAQFQKAGLLPSDLPAEVVSDVVGQVAEGLVLTFQFLTHTDNIYGIAAFNLQSLASTLGAEHTGILLKPSVFSEIMGVPQDWALSAFKSITSAGDTAPLWERFTTAKTVEEARAVAGELVSVLKMAENQKKVISSFVAALGRKYREKYIQSTQEVKEVIDIRQALKSIADVATRQTFTPEELHSLHYLLANTPQPPAWAEVAAKVKEADWKSLTEMERMWVFAKIIEAAFEELKNWAKQNSLEERLPIPQTIPQWAQKATDQQGISYWFAEGQRAWLEGRRHPYEILTEWYSRLRQANQQNEQIRALERARFVNFVRGYLSEMLKSKDIGLSQAIEEYMQHHEVGTLPSQSKAAKIVEDLLSKRAAIKTLLQPLWEKPEKGGWRLKPHSTNPIVRFMELAYWIRKMQIAQEEVMKLAAEPTTEEAARLVALDVLSELQRKGWLSAAEIDEFVKSIDISRKWTDEEKQQYYGLIAKAMTEMFVDAWKVGGLSASAHNFYRNLVPKESRYKIETLIGDVLLSHVAKEYKEAANRLETEYGIILPAFRELETMFGRWIKSEVEAISNSVGGLTEIEELVIIKDLGNIANQMVRAYLQEVQRAPQIKQQLGPEHLHAFLSALKQSLRIALSKIHEALQQTVEKLPQPAVTNVEAIKNLRNFFGIETASDLPVQGQTAIKQAIERWIQTGSVLANEIGADVLKNIDVYGQWEIVESGLRRGDFVEHYLAAFVDALNRNSAREVGEILEKWVKPLGYEDVNAWLRSEFGREIGIEDLMQTLHGRKALAEKVESLLDKYAVHLINQRIASLQSMIEHVEETLKPIYQRLFEIYSNSIEGTANDLIAFGLSHIDDLVAMLKRDNLLGTIQGDLYHVNALLQTIANELSMTKVDAMLRSTVGLLPPTISTAVWEVVMTINSLRGRRRHLDFLTSRRQGMSLTKGLALLSALAITPILITHLPALTADILTAIRHNLQLAAPSWLMWGAIGGALAHFFLRKAPLKAAIGTVIQGLANFVQTFKPAIEIAWQGLRTAVVDQIRRHAGNEMAAKAELVLEAMGTPEVYFAQPWVLSQITHHLRNYAVLTATHPASVRGRELAHNILNAASASGLTVLTQELTETIYNLARLSRQALLLQIALPRIIQNPKVAEVAIKYRAAQKVLSAITGKGFGAIYDDKAQRFKTYGEVMRRRKNKPSAIFSTTIYHPQSGIKRRYVLEDTVKVTHKGAEVELQSIPVNELLLDVLGTNLNTEMELWRLFNNPVSAKGEAMRLREELGQRLKTIMTQSMLSALDENQRRAYQFFEEHLEPSVYRLAQALSRPEIALAIVSNPDAFTMYLFNLFYLRTLLDLPHINTLLPLVGVSPDVLRNALDNFFTQLRSSHVSARLLDEIERTYRRIENQLLAVVQHLNKPNVTAEQVSKIVSATMQKVRQFLMPMIDTRYTPFLRVIKGGRRLPSILAHSFLKLENDIRTAFYRAIQEPVNERLWNLVLNDYSSEARTEANIGMLTGRLQEISPLRLMFLMDQSLTAFVKKLAQERKISADLLAQDLDTLLWAVYVHSTKDGKVKKLSDVFGSGVVGLNYEHIWKEVLQDDKVKKMIWWWVMTTDYAIQRWAYQAWIGDITYRGKPSFAMFERRYVPQWGDEFLKPTTILHDFLEDIAQRLAHMQLPRQRFERERTGRGITPIENFRAVMRRAVSALVHKDALDKSRPVINALAALAPAPLRDLIGFQILNALHPNLMVSTGENLPIVLGLGQDIAEAMRTLLSHGEIYFRDIVGDLEVARQRGGDYLNNMLQAYQNYVLLFNPDSVLRQPTSLIVAGARLAWDFKDLSLLIKPALFLPRAVMIILSQMRGKPIKLNPLEQVVLSHSPELQSRHNVWIRTVAHRAREVLETMMSDPDIQRAVETLLDPAASTQARQNAQQFISAIFTEGIKPSLWARFWEGVQRWGYAALRLMDEAAVLASKLAATYAYLACEAPAGQIGDPMVLKSAIHYGSAQAEQHHSTPLEGFRPILFRGGRGGPAYTALSRVLYIPQIFSQFLVYTFAHAENYRVLLGGLWDAITDKTRPLRERLDDIALAISLVALTQLAYAVYNGIWSAFRGRPLENLPLGEWTSEEESSFPGVLQTLGMRIANLITPRPVTLTASWLLNLFFRRTPIHQTVVGSVSERDLPPALSAAQRMMWEIIGAVSTLANFFDTPPEKTFAERLQMAVDNALWAYPPERRWQLILDAAQLASLLASYRYRFLSYLPLGVVGKGTRAFEGMEKAPMPAHTSFTFAKHPTVANVVQFFGGMPAPHGFSELLNPTPIDVAVRGQPKPAMMIAVTFVNETERSPVPMYVSELVRFIRGARQPAVIAALKYLLSPAFYLRVSRGDIAEISPNHPFVFAISQISKALQKSDPDEFVRYIVSNPVDFAYILSIWGYKGLFNRLAGDKPPTWVKEMKGNPTMLLTMIVNAGMSPELASSLAAIIDKSETANLLAYLQYHWQKVKTEMAERTAHRRQQRTRKVFKGGEQ